MRHAGKFQFRFSNLIYLACLLRLILDIDSKKCISICLQITTKTQIKKPDNKKIKQCTIHNEISLLKIIIRVPIEIDISEYYDFQMQNMATLALKYIMRKN